MSSESANELPEIDIAPLGRALDKLDLAIAAWNQRPDDTFIRDAVIQRFEFTYELLIRVLRRYIRLFAGSDDEADELTFKELIRRANELKVLRGSTVQWLDFRQARTDTVHTYNELRAVEVAGSAERFASEAHFFLDSLARRFKA